ncbi:MAG TPA: hypothetical protein VFZ65_05610 [Planctomycetota bacterium]|nr:hypothetical protein [Planctomycetota bacterium]
MKLALAPFVLALTALPAQQPFRISDYLPNDYRCMMRVDLKAMRDQGIWDDFESGAMKMMIGSLEREAGFPLASLDRVMQIATFAPDAAPRQDPDRLVTLEGNAPLERRNDPNYTSEKIGGHDVLVHAQSQWLCFQPRPEVRIEGARVLLEPVLAGKPNAGAPCADILSLQSTRKHNLIEFAFDLTVPMLREESLGKLFAGVEWPDGQAPRFLYGCVHALGEADDPHFGVQIVVRHLTAGDGLAATEKALDGLLAKVAAEPKLRMVHDLLAGLERSRDHGDLILKVDLGRTRDAAGKLAMAMMAMTTTRTEEVKVMVAPPPPAPPDPAKKQ